MRATVLLPLVLLVHPEDMSAQPHPSGYVVEMNTRERWVHAGEQPQFRPFITDRSGSTSTRSKPLPRTLHLRIDNEGPYGRLVQDSNGAAASPRA